MPDSISSKKVINIATYNSQDSFEFRMDFAQNRPIICRYLESKPDKLINPEFTTFIDNVYISGGFYNNSIVFGYQNNSQFNMVFNVLDILTGLPEETFMNCQTLASITAMPSYTIIGKNAFAGCSSLKMVNLPESVHELYENAFNGCFKLTSIDLSNINFLYDYSFAGMGIKHIELNNAIQELTPYLFKDCKNLYDFSNTNIYGYGRGTFENCANLQYLELGNIIRETESRRSPEGTMVLDPEFEDPTIIPDNPDEPVEITEWVLVDNYNGQGLQIAKLTREIAESLTGSPTSICNLVTNVGDTVAYCIYKSNVNYHIYYLGGEIEKSVTNDLSKLIVERDPMTKRTLYGDNLSKDFTTNSESDIEFMTNSDGSIDWQNVKITMKCHEVWMYLDEEKTSYAPAYYIYPDFIDHRLETDQDDFYRYNHPTNTAVGIKQNVYIDQHLKPVINPNNPDLLYPLYQYGYREFGIDIVNSGTGETIRMEYVNPTIAEQYQSRWDRQEVKDILGNIITYYMFNPMPEEGTYGMRSLLSKRGGDSDDDGMIFGAPSLYNKIPDYLLCGCSSLKLNHFTMGGIEFNTEDIVGQITEVGTASFMGCKMFDDLSMSRFTKIGAYAFKDCSSLVDINLDSCTSIGKYAFKGCQSLTTLSIPNDCFDFNAIGIFENCTSLQSIGDTYLSTNVPKKMFKNCFELAEFPFENVTHIYDQAFANCYNLIIDENVDLSNIKHIGKYAFYNCDGISRITFNNEAVIQDAAFMNCSNIRNIELPESVNEFSHYMFAGCQRLETITFTSAFSPVNQINLDALDKCSNLSEIYIPVGGRYHTVNNNCIVEAETNTIVYVCKNIQRFTFDENLAGYKIADNAFNGSKISLIYIGEGLNAPDINTLTFKNIENYNFHVLISREDPNFRKYYNILGKNHLYYK